jgi:hypothetical protein
MTMILQKKPEKSKICKMRRKKQKGRKSRNISDEAAHLDDFARMVKKLGLQKNWL